ncbi:MAG: motility associated factor glycosyltransferase family protein [Succinivibrio sp.]|nr:motility associated factor glycosyltransferase family protein [Succinivibrio sp.]
MSDESTKTNSEVKPDETTKKTRRKAPAKQTAQTEDKSAAVKKTTKSRTTAKSKAKETAAAAAGESAAASAKKADSSAKSSSKGSKKSAAPTKAKVKPVETATQTSQNSQTSQTKAQPGAGAVTLGRAAPVEKEVEVSPRFKELVMKPGSLTLEELNELGNFAPAGLNLQEKIMAMRERNLQALNEYVHDVYERFKDYAPSRELTLFCGENGEINLCFRDRREILYHGASPRAVCREQLDGALKRNIERVRFGGSADYFGQIHMRYVNEIDEITLEKLADPLNPEQLGEVPAVVMLGLGLGYVMEELLNRITCSLLVMIEPDKDLFLASLFCFDWKTLLERIGAMGCRGQLLVGMEPDEMYDHLQNHYMQHGRFMASETWFCAHYESAVLAKVREKLQRNYGFMCDALGFFDDQMFGISHLCNDLEHGRPFIRNDVELPVKWKDAPLCVVGNGPSLDKDIAFLRRYQDQMIIMACGTAIDTLYHAGIQPDIFAITERVPQEEIMIQLIPDDEYIKHCVFIGSDVTHPNVVAHFDKVALFGKPDEAGYWMLREFSEGGSKIKPIGVMNPLVGNLGVAAAVALKFRNVYLFGLDHGRAVGGADTHSKHSAIYQQGGWDESGYTYDETVPGNFGGKFEIGGIFKLGRHNVEEVIRIGEASGSGVKFFNCSDGAEIRGAKPLRNSVLAAKLKKQPALDKSKFVKFITEELTLKLPEDHATVLKMVDKERFAKLCDYLIGLWQEPATTRREHVRRMTESIEALSGAGIPLGEKVPLFMGMMLRGTAESVFISVLYALYGVQDLDFALSRAGRIVQKWVYFLEDAKKVYAFLPDFVMGEQHYEKMGGKIGYDHEGSPAPDFPAEKKWLKNDYEEKQKKFVKRYK